MQGRKSAASKLLIATILSMLLISTYATQAHGFTNGQSAALVIGQQDFTTGNSSTTMNGLSGPEQAGFDSSGNLWVPDAGNNRILEFSSSSASVTSTTSPSTQTTTSSATSQSSQTSATTTTQGLGQLPYIAAGAVVVVVAVGLIAVFLLRSRKKRGAAQGST